MGAVRKFTGAKDAKWAGRDQAKAIERGISEQKQAYAEVAPGIAQFMLPQYAAGFGFQPSDIPTLAPPATTGTGAPMTGEYIPAGGFGAAPGAMPMDPLSQLRAASGVMGPEAQQSFYDAFVEDPGTQFLRDEGMRDINRQMQARGGLGGGSRLKAITEFSQGLANQQLGSRLQELAGLAQTDLSLASQLAGLRTGLGSNVASGLAQAGAARTQGELAGAGLTGQFYGNVMNMAGQMLGGKLPMPSDRRLKDNLHLVGIHDGIKWYQWDWNEKAREIGWHTMPRFGVIAQEISEAHPDCVVMDTDTGYLKVNYGRLFSILNLEDEVA